MMTREPDNRFKTATDVLKAYSEGRITDRQACSLLGISPDELDEIMRRGGFALPFITRRREREPRRAIAPTPPKRRGQRPRY